MVINSKEESSRASMEAGKACKKVSTPVSGSKLALEEKPVKRRKKTGTSGPISGSKLALITLRYHPPGMGLTYKDFQGKRKQLHFDLLQLHYGSDTKLFTEQILSAAPSLKHGKCKRNIMNAVDKLRETCNFDYSKKYVSFTVIKPHSLPLTDACFSKSGMKCVTSSLGNACKVWCCLTGNEIGPLACHTDAVTSVNITLTGENILTSSYDGTVRHWYHSDQEGYAFCNRTIPICCSRGKVLFAKYAPDFKRAAAGTTEKTLCVVDLEKGSLLRRLQVEIKNSQLIKCANFDRSGDLLLGSPYDGNKAAVWDLRSGEVAITLNVNSSGVVNKSLFDFTTTFIGTSSKCTDECPVKVWDIRNTESPLHSLECENSEAGDIEFDGRGHKLAGGTKEGTVIVWDVQQSGKSVLKIKTDDSPILKVGWNPNGALLMSSNEVGTVKLFHSEMGNCVQILPDHTRELVSAAFNYTSDYLMTASKDKTVRIHKHTSI